MFAVGLIVQHVLQANDLSKAQYFSDMINLEKSRLYSQEIKAAHACRWKCVYCRTEQYHSNSNCCNCGGSNAYKEN